MGIGDFFKNIFGKKTCAFCGGECGMMSRTKIKGDEFICSKCDDNCSVFIRKSRYTKAELEEHIAYMKRSDRLYNEILVPESKKRQRYPSATQRQGVEFFDDFGMFHIIDDTKDRDERFPKELIRYDQVASYEPYIEEAEPAEAGKPKVFKEGGIKLVLVKPLDDLTKMRKGLRPHPYILEPIKIRFATNEREKENNLKYVDNVIAHFNYIFGVNDNQKGLFNFGMTEAEKRELKANVAFAKTAFEAVKAAKNGGEISEEKQAEIKENLNAMHDADTEGLGKYIRAADAVEERVK